MALWSLTSYKKIIYIDSGSVMIHNFDDMFDLPANSLLLQNWPNNIEKLIILKPSSSTYDKLLKLSIHQHSSTDGVLGTYLMADTFYPIPYSVVRLVGDKPRTLQDAKLLMFDGNIKPWNWYTAQDDAWLKNWDPDSMWQWRHHRNVIQYLFNGSKGLSNSINRTRNVCNQKQLSKFFPITDKFSVLLSTYNPDRIDHVTTLIRHLATSDLVHTIYLTWHNPKLEVSKELQELQEKLRKPLVILRQQFDSLNNRFNPIEGLETSAVYILDDDIVVSVPDLEFSFQVWQNRQHSIVGHFPRFHSYNSTNGRAIYAMADNKRPTYSVVLTKSMFIRSEYLFAYTCLMDPALHEYVDANLNCEDIGFSLMVSGLTSVTNVYVAVKSRIRDYGLSQGISTNGNHIKARRECISNMIGTFWKGNDPTRMTSEMVSSFEAARYARGTWDQLAKEVESIESRF
ncbi:hypothetical protein K450DRAFT_198674 [Umbelopsis ramanniana AG]|uniref:Glycosyl transferase 64 domain-containing protein n=1 Tax=Umbelopsis ramanniana AG TaxID=1314678 RepID=A0AAD5EB97_UMBRA|nr:uncharacterized protein K450DRAFT_198674 [Umbelopsis ramanniana AG]KAI8580284.1 hypothetical protein K450DRAFT_198674 [Umbelopsis ramanniana AG]